MRVIWNGTIRTISTSQKLILLPLKCRRASAYAASESRNNDNSETPSAKMTEFAKRRANGIAVQISRYASRLGSTGSRRSE